MLLLIPSALALAAVASPPPNVPADRGIDLIGVGLVVGLDGTGSRSTFTRQMAVDLVERIGRGAPARLRHLASRGMRNRPGPFRWPGDGVTEGLLRVGNVSAVMVSARLVPGAGRGDRVDVTVSTLDEAPSLRGGSLLPTPLKGPDGQVYVVTALNWPDAVALPRRIPPGTRGTTATIEKGGLVERPVR